MLLKNTVRTFGPTYQPLKHISHDLTRLVSNECSLNMLLVDNQHEVYVLEIFYGLDALSQLIGLNIVSLPHNLDYHPKVVVFRLL